MACEGTQRGLTVSLTSLPERFYELHLVLESLLSQTLRPDRIVLWLGHAEGSGRQPPGLPRRVARLTRFGVEVRQCVDIGPHTKLLPALESFPNDVVVTADDDILYPTNWLEGLWRSYENHPQAIHCYRARRILWNAEGRVAGLDAWPLVVGPEEAGPSKDLCATGVGGVLYPPTALPSEAFDTRALRQLCPRNDDIWFKAMSLLNDVPTFRTRGGFDLWRFVQLGSSRRQALWDENRGAQNAAQVKAVFDFYHLHRKLAASTWDASG